MSRRLPSINELLRSAGETYLRFPMTMISSFLFTVCALFLIEHNNSILFRTVFASVLGIPLFTAFESYAELNSVSFRRRFMVFIGGAAFLVMFGTMFPASGDNIAEMHLIRFFVIFLGFHLFAAYLPVVLSQDLTLFWLFNKKLFLRIITAVIFSVILFAGLSVALASIDNLFAVNIRPEWYQRIWVIVVGVFNTWFFLSGVPKSIQEIREDSEYPKELKLVTLNILLPLVLVYVVILYTYGAKIMIEWDWPKGWVGYLVLGFSLSGILSLLLVWPLRNNDTMRWIRSFNRTFYIALLPLSLLLLLAIWRRISEYGMTENRYYVVVLGVWLLAASLYFTFSAAKNIKLIPISLSLIALISVYGPWSSFSVSENIQIGRLEKILLRNDILNNTGASGELENIPFKDNKEICEIIRYVTEHFGTERLSQVIPIPSEKPAGYGRDAEVKRIVAGLNIPYIPTWQNDFPIQTRHFIRIESPFLNIAPYDELYDDISLSRSDSVAVIPVANGTLQCTLSETSIQIVRDAGSQQQFSLLIDLKELLARLEKHRSNDGTDAARIDQTEMTITTSVSGTNVMIIIDTININDSPLSVKDVTMDLFIGR
jgi:hypothetical protein